MIEHMKKHRILGHRVTQRDESPVSPEVIEANKRWDATFYQRPSWLIPVPPGFSKALDDDELDAICRPYHAMLVQQTIDAAKPKEL